MTIVEQANKVMHEAAVEINRLRAVNEELLAALDEVRDLLDGYIDVVDGDYGRPAPNKAMRAAQIIDAALTKGRV